MALNIIFDDYEFSEPIKIIEWEPPESKGLYVILKPSLSGPVNLPFQPIYFGQTENFSERGFIESHGKYECWEREAGSKEDIFIAIFLMPDSTEEERMEIESHLIARYRTNEICND